MTFERKPRKKNPKTPRRSGVALALLLFRRSVNSFAPRPGHESRWRSRALSTAAGGDDFDFGAPIGDDSDGRALAREFYEQIRTREKLRAEEEKIMRAEEEARLHGGPTDAPPPSAGLFPGGGATVFVTPLEHRRPVVKESSSLETGGMTRSEFDGLLGMVASSAEERLIILQALIVVAMVLTYAGTVSGGIAMTLPEVPMAELDGLLDLDGLTTALEGVAAVAKENVIGTAGSLSADLDALIDLDGAMAAVEGIAAVAKENVMGTAAHGLELDGLLDLERLTAVVEGVAAVAKEGAASAGVANLVRL